VKAKKIYIGRKGKEGEHNRRKRLWAEHKKKDKEKGTAKLKRAVVQRGCRQRMKPHRARPGTMGGRQKQKIPN
jgi:hypothetical protein